MSRIVYIADIRFPTEKAHGIQIARMCEAFADQGHEVELVVPSRLNTITESPYGFYGVKQNFKVRKVWSLDVVRFGPLGFLVHAVTFAMTVFFLYWREKGLIYTRDTLLVVLLSILGKRVCCEIHDIRNNIFFSFVVQRVNTVVVITKALKEALVDMGVSGDTIIVAPDGVALQMFDISLSQDEARRATGLPRDRQIVMYTGHLYSWKGADVLARAAQYIPSALFVFVGGTKEDVKVFSERYSQDNVHILGHQRYENIPQYLKAADVLVLPNTVEKKISNLYTSPLKLFEYMAVKRPIIASDLPSLREILNEEMAAFFHPGDPEDLANRIGGMLSNVEQATFLASRAREAVSVYSWNTRAERICEANKL